MPAAKEMSFEDVVTGVAKALDLKAMLDTPEGRAVVARAVNDQIDVVKEKLGSEIAEERKLRTAAEEAAADLLMRFEKFERRMAYDRDFGMHRGVDGKIQPSISRESADALVKVVRALRVKDMEALRAVSSGTGSEGGYLLQEAVANDILRLIPTTGTYPLIARPWPMGEKKINIGDVLSQMGAYWPEENTAITESFPGFGKVQLDAKLCGALIPVPLSLIEDSTPDLGQLFADLIRECISKEIDRVGIAGRSAANGGTDVFDGLLNTSGLVTRVLATGDMAISDSTPDDLLSLQTTVPDGAREDCAYLLSPTYFEFIRKTKTTQGEYTTAHFVTLPMNGQPGTIWGRPYYLTERLPAYSTVDSASKRFALYGNFKKFAIFGTRKEMSVATSDVAADAFKNVQLIIRGITRIAMASFGQAIAALETAAS